MNSNMSESFCRLCINHSSVLLDIFNTKYDKVLFPDIIEQFLSIKVYPTDISVVICNECYQPITKFYKFYNFIKNAQMKLSDLELKLLEKTSLEVKLESTKLNNEEDTLTDIKEEPIFFKDTTSEQSDDAEMCSDLFSMNTVEVSNMRKHEDLDLSAEKSQVIFVMKNKSLSRSKSKEKRGKKLSKTKVRIKCINHEPETDDIPLNKLLNKNNEIDNMMENSDSFDKLMIEKDLYDTNNIIKSSTADIIKKGKLALKGRALDELHNSFYNIHCDICEDVPKFDNLKMMFKHYLYQHSTPGYVKCCDTHFYDLEKINSHIVRHLQPTSVVCPVCNKKITTKKSLTVHLQTHLPMSERRHQCGQCDKGFVQLSQLKSHKQLHIPIEQRNTYLCELCGKSFYTLLSRNIHVKSVHSTKECLCAECGRAFKTEAFLLAHVKRIHDPDGDPKMKCPKCNAVCKKSTIKYHMKTHEEKGIQCTICNYMTFSKRNINIHMNRKHSEVRPHSCSLCSKKFKVRIALEQHMALHTGIHKYSCEYCSKTFASSGNYFTHRKRMHADKLLNKKQTERNDNIQVYDPTEQENSKTQDLDLVRTELKKIKFKTMVVKDE